MAIVDPRDISGLVAWYSAEAEAGYTNGQAMTGWTDQSGNGNHAVAGTTAPVWRSTLGSTSGPTVEFETAWFNLPSGVMTSATAGEVATFARARVDPQGWWNFGTNGDPSHFPYSGSLYDSFGSTGRPSTGAVSLDTWYRYQVMSKAGTWTAWRNGTQVYTTGTNTVAWPTVPAIGWSNASWQWRGRMSVFVLYNRELTTTERSDLDAWIAANPSGGLPIAALDLSGAGTLTSSATVGATGDSSLGGGGTLTSDSVVNVSGDSALVGDGTLAAGELFDFVGTLDTSGSGELGLSGSVSVSGAGALSGSGTLTLAGVPKPIATRTFSGAGTLTHSGKPNVGGAVTLSGSGLLHRTESFPLDGAGALTSTSVAGLKGTLAASGAGTLTLAGPAANFTGAGTLTGTVTLTEGSSSGGFGGAGVLVLAGRSDALNAPAALGVTQTHAEEIGWFRIFATPPGGDTTEITMFRGVPALVSGLSTKDPFSEEISSISFPQITLWDIPGEGDLDWLVPYSNIDIIWHNTGATSYSYQWEGFIVDESVSLGENDSVFTVECKGALYQLDNYLAKPTYPQQPIPYEVLLRDAFDPFLHPGSAVEPLGIEWPTGWDEIVPDFQSGQRQWFLRPWGVVTGQKWTGLTARNTGNWEPTLTAYVQSMLSLMFTKGGGQWTIRNDRGRKPILFLREPATASDPNLVVITPGIPGVTVQFSKDYTQSANVIYGRGQDIAGTQYSGMEVSLDGRSTYYQPFAFSPESHPDEANPRFDPYTIRREVQIEFPSGMNARAAEKVAKAQFKRFEDPGYTGEIVLKTDPKLLDGTPIPRFLIRAGSSVKVEGFRGIDLVMHVTATEWSMDSGEMRLTVDSKYRDALTVDEVRERTRDALATIRLISPGSFNTRTEDMLLPWSYSEGSGVMPQAATSLFFTKAKNDEPFPWRSLALQYPPKDFPEYYVKIKNPDRLTNASKNWASWNGSIEDGAVPVRFAQQGTVRLTQIAAYDKNGNVLPVRFHVGVYNNSGTNRSDMPRYPGNPTKILAPPGADFRGGQNNPFFKDAFEEMLNSGAVQSDGGYTYHESAGFQMGWGNYYEPAGYSPGLASRGAPKTGMLHDEQAWRFDTTQDPNFDVQDPKMAPMKYGVGALYIMIYCDDRTESYKGPVYFLGRFFRQEPGL